MPGELVRPQNEQTYKPMRYVLQSFQKMEDDLKRQNELMKRWMEQPMKDLARYAEITKTHRESLDRALEMVRIPKFDWDLIRPIAKMPVVNIQRDIELDIPTTHTTSEESAADRKILIKAMDRLAAAYEKSNQLMEEAARIRNKEKKKMSGQILILDEDAKLYFQKKLKVQVDLSKAPLQRRILIALAESPVSSEQLFTKSRAKNKGSFYKAIEQLNSKTKNKFGLKNKPIINDDSGYRMLSAYKLISKIRLERS